MFSHKTFSSLFVGIVVAGILTGCGRLNPFADVVTTSINVDVENKSTGEMGATGDIYERVNSDECDDDYSTSGQSVLLPGDTMSISLSVKCLGPARTSIKVYKDVNYDIGKVSIRNPAMAALLIPGLQFRVALQDHSNPLTVQIVSAPPQTERYSHYWPVAPNGAVQVAWLRQKPSNSAAPQSELIFSLPKGSADLNLFIEFDDNLGITEFGNHQIEHINGVYRSYFGQQKGLTIFSALSLGRLVCDDVGCNEIQ